MSTHERKARKRAGRAFVRAAKTPTPLAESRGLGLVSGSEILAAIVVRDLWRRGKR